MDVLSVVLLIAAIVFAALYWHARADTTSAARQQYDRWRATDREQIIRDQRSIALREAHTQLLQWQIEQEAQIRQDAIARSKSVIVGKVTEHVAPWLPVFPYNPKDARFIGSPVDMIVFDGADNDDIQRLIFLEVKTNTAGLTTRQRQIRDAIKEHRVEWQQLSVPTEQSASTSLLAEPRRLIPDRAV